MKNFWQTVYNSESNDGTWEITVDPETKTVKFQFWDYEDQGTNYETLKKRVDFILSYDQYQSLLDFSARMNRRVWNHIDEE